MKLSHSHGPLATERDLRDRERERRAESEETRRPLAATRRIKHQGDGTQVPDLLLVESNGQRADEGRDKGQGTRERGWGWEGGCASLNFEFCALRSYSSFEKKVDSVGLGTSMLFLSS